jgi:hypothetical protein
LFLQDLVVPDDQLLLGSIAPAALPVAMLV